MFRPKVLSITTRIDFRRWLENNHDTARECWETIYKGKTTKSNKLFYLDAVEEALCFGWIDSTNKIISNFGMVQRFSPRAIRSQWSQLNKARCRRLERLGLMTDAGRIVLPDIYCDKIKIDSDILQKLQSSPKIWGNFRKFPDLYKRVRIDTIQRCRSNHELFQYRLAKFLKKTAAGIMFGEWHDNGQLLNY